MTVPDELLQSKQVVPIPKDDPGALGRTMRDVLNRNWGGVVGTVGQSTRPHGLRAGQTPEAAESP